MANIDKGSRVRILKGKGKEQEGTVFWTGANNYGPGIRLGVRNDEGDTFWVNEDQVEVIEGEVADVSPAKPDGAALEKGGRVRWSQDGGGTGVVFWVGESKGGSLRVGIKTDEDGETVWMFADRVKAEAEAAGEAEVEGEAAAAVDPHDAIPF